MRSLPAAMLHFFLLLAPALNAGKQKDTVRAPRAIDLTAILSWKRIQSPALSNDGAWFAYRLSPQEGNSEVVIRSTSSNKELRFPAGVAELGGPLSFSHDSKWLAYTIPPAAKDAKKLVDLEWPESPYNQLDAQGRYDNTIIALISLLKAESLRQPLILFMEDAHYLDEDSKAFIPRLKRALAAEAVSYPIAILMTTRWQGTKVLLEDGLINQDIDLRALSDESIASMAQDFLDNRLLPD